MPAQQILYCIQKYVLLVFLLKKVGGQLVSFIIEQAFGCQYMNIWQVVKCMISLIYQQFNIEYLFKVLLMPSDLSELSEVQNMDYKPEEMFSLQKKQTGQRLYKNKEGEVYDGTFTEDFKGSVIMQWYDATFNYIEMEPYLSFCLKTYENFHRSMIKEGEEDIHYLTLPHKIQGHIVTIDKHLKQFLQFGGMKFMAFLNFMYADITHHWRQMQLILKRLSILQLKTHQDCLKRHQIKEVIKILYTQIHCLGLYISINQKCQDYIQGVRSKCVLPFLPQWKIHGQVKPIENSYDLDIVDEISARIVTMQSTLKNFYSHLVDFQQKKTKGLQSLTTTHSRKLTKPKQYFLIGFFIGLTTFSIIVGLGLILTSLVTIDSDPTKIDSVDNIFPMFRGIGLLILYYWGNAWNIYGFNTHRINYRFILDYGSHYSTYFQIIKRAGFFTVVFIIMLLTYFVGQSYGIHNNVNTPVQYTPFVVWILFLGYIFFPNSEVFNPDGRKYFYRLLKMVIFSPVGKMSFLISWATDQAVSFIIPIKDMAYTICFYTSDFKIQSVKQCLNYDSFEGVIVLYIVALIPLGYRMIQCYNQAIQTSGKFIGHIQMWNFLKYFSSVLTASLSFINALLNNQYFYYYMVSSIVSTLYAYYWDLKYDWGFLQIDKTEFKLLRRNLSYHNPKYYYMAIGINLILRCSWTLTISPSITKIIPKSTLLPFITGLLQIFRRCLWNFFRIEKEHIANCTAFRVTKDVAPIIKLLQADNNMWEDNIRGGSGQSSLLDNLLEADCFLYSNPKRKSFVLSDKDNQFDIQASSKQVEKKKKIFFDIVQEQIEAIKIMRKDQVSKLVRNKRHSDHKNIPGVQRNSSAYSVDRYY